MQNVNVAAQKGYPEAVKAISDANKKVKEREIEREMVNLNVSVEGLNEALAALLSRLEPVVRFPFESTEKTNAAPVKTTVTPMGAYLRTQSNKLELLTELLHDAYERLELP